MWRRCDRCTLHYIHIRIRTDGEDTLGWPEALLASFDLFLR